QKLKTTLHTIFHSLMTLQLLELASGSRILAAFFFPGKSHFMMTNAVIRELVKRGHEVTFITPWSLAEENLGENYKEILFAQYDALGDMHKISQQNTLLESSDLPMPSYIKMLYTLGVRCTDFAYEQPEIQAVINAKDKISKYDLLLTEQFFHEGLLMLGHIHQIPIVTMSTSKEDNFFSQISGIVYPWSYVPHALMGYTDRMTLWERIGNVFVSGFDDLVRELSFYPQHDAVLEKHFSKLMDRVPPVKELMRNISVILVNSYMPLSPAAPTSYNVIQVGGLHIQPAKTLPEDLKQFLDEAKHGAIYFSLGSRMSSAELSPEKLRIFLKVFGSLKQRILWKFEDESLDNLPPNVRLQRWLPQNDVLAHPNVKVFINHGGLFGTQEAVYHGVPTLGMPVHADQYSNVNREKQVGYGLVLDLRRFTEEEFRQALKEVLENPKYKITTERASRIFKDRPVSAMDTAMYWIEYVIEHQGASHLVTAGVNLPWYQFYLLDIIGLGLVFLLITISVMVNLYRKLISIAFKNKTKKD
ncbi:hypothetical protein KR054_002412, partial [Drosophila jambulina]